MKRTAKVLRAGLYERKRKNRVINYDEEIRNFRSSLDISAVEDQIVQRDLTDMTDILMEILKSEVQEKKDERG